MIVETLQLLFTRDLGRLRTEIALYRNEENIWKTEGSIANSAGNYTIEEHKNKISGELADVFEAIRDYIMNLSDSIEETPKR